MIDLQPRNHIRNYIKNNLFIGVRTKPSLSNIIAPFVLYSGVAIGYGLLSGLFGFELIESELIFILPITLFLFPSLLEEIVFRGLMIPIDTREKGFKGILGYTLSSTALFVLWHPLNALTINQGAQAFFFDGRFLFIVSLLGLVCSYSYIYSKSIWVPAMIHWLTVVVWVFFLGGRNLLLELR
uniref:CAAX protease self-immunity n=1 Tax=Candidatus Kentrum sp. FM TaxID=2126340 RepID=A0A450W438_9GAMM|nr:MAG: CAAX protease self-immunity [Candidatus Kentron sp. FM]VFJ58606.1 MAG: CAAX protease self-immunity [Candidatus Kentron sp. FM]VFK11779.1 MAG: CAAX protease self-immunity [Candidatus Kentron sp. FM]